MTVTRSGARLRTHQHGFTYRIAQMTADDIKQKTCPVCGHPINDDRCLKVREEDVLYCSKRCKATARRRRCDVPIGRATKWRAVYAAAREAHGAWIKHACESEAQAKEFTFNVNQQRRDFEATRDGSTVSIRLVAA